MPFSYACDHLFQQRWWPFPHRPAHSTWSLPHGRSSHSRPLDQPNHATGHTSSAVTGSYLPQQNQLKGGKLWFTFKRRRERQLTNHSGSSCQSCSCAMIEVISSSSTKHWELHASVGVYSSCKQENIQVFLSLNGPYIVPPGITSFSAASTTLTSVGTPSRSQPTFLKEREANIKIAQSRVRRPDDSIFTVHICSELSVCVNYSTSPDQESSRILAHVPRSTAGTRQVCMGLSTAIIFPKQLAVSNFTASNCACAEKVTVVGSLCGSVCFTNEQSSYERTCLGM